MLRLYYRISDKSYPKAKLPGSNKEVCFMNFCKAFASIIFQDMNDTPPVRIIADNCERKTVKMLMDTGLPVFMTNLGNAGSLKKTFEIALDEGEDEDLAYFIEDDYLHLPNAPYVLKEGLRIAHYVTLYDHPDKYTRVYGGGEVSKVMRTPLSHWRFTQSTCMTFGCKVGTLREDKSVWDKWTDGDHPHDHKAFTELNKKERTLAVSIPGVACHTDLTFSGSINHVMIDSWAIELMIEELRQELQNYYRGKLEESDDYRYTVGSKTGWSALISLDALLFNKKGEQDT